MEGHGEYILPNGTKYVGQMVDGEFHGEGTLIFQNGAKFTAIWEHGRATGTTPSRGDYFFADGLKFEEIDWEYCTDDDRRFYQELLHGLQPAGDGYLDPNTNHVMTYEGGYLREAGSDELEWAKTFCRKGN
eukprot:gene2816-5659_t